MRRDGDVGVGCWRLRESATPRSVGSIALERYGAGEPTVLRI